MTSAAPYIKDTTVFPFAWELRSWTCKRAAARSRRRSLRRRYADLLASPKPLAFWRRRVFEIRYLTNTTTRPRRAIVDRLNDMGFDLTAEHIFTPGIAAGQLLRRKQLTRIHLAAAHELVEDLPDVEFVDDEPQAIVLGDLFRAFDWDRLNMLFRMMRQGVVLVALRPCGFLETIPAPEGLFRTNMPGPAAHQADTLLIAYQSTIFGNGVRLDIRDMARSVWTDTVKWDGLTPHSVVFSSDGNSLFVNGRSIAGRWDLLTGKFEDRRPSSLALRSYPFADSVLYTGVEGDDWGQLMVRSSRLGERRIEWEPPEVLYSEFDIQSASGSELLMVARQANENIATIFDLASAAEGKAGAKRSLILPYRPDYPDYSLSPDGRVLLGTARNALVAYDAQTGETLWALDEGEMDITVGSTAFTADGSRVFIHASYGLPTLQVRNALTGERLYAAPHYDTLLARDGAQIGLAMVEDKSFLLRLDEFGQNTGSTSLQGVRAKGAYWHAATGMVLVKGFDQRQMLWRPDTQESFVLEAYPSHDDGGVAFSPHGDLLALVESNGTISL